MDRNDEWTTIETPPGQEPVRLSAEIRDGNRGGKALERTEQPLDPRERESVLERFTVHSL